VELCSATETKEDKPSPTLTLVLLVLYFNMMLIQRCGLLVEGDHQSQKRLLTDLFMINSCFATLLLKMTELDLWV